MASGGGEHSEVSFIGIDIGTSSVKAVLAGEDQAILAEADVPLATDRPQPGWSEQAPDDWWRAVVAALGRIQDLQPAPYAATRAVGLSGQMHGAVLLDAGDRPIRPAILWNDSRSHAECQDLMRAVPDLDVRAGVPAMPGLTAPKLLWLERHEPENFRRIARVMLPKDFVRLKLTGEHATDMSDAAGTLWLDEARRDWYPAAVAASGLALAALPRLVEGIEPTGRLRPEVAAQLGLSDRVVVAGGAGDAAAGAVGIGAIAEGDAFLSLGTSAQYLVVRESYRPCRQGVVHAFAHAVPQRWFQMAALLSGASCLKWFAGAVGSADIDGLLARVAARGKDPSPVLFLPYLAGERTPHDDPFARGVFFGLAPDTTTEDLARSVLEGVAFSLVDGRDAIAAAAPVPSRLAAIGGGSRSRLWIEIIASALGQPISVHDSSRMGPAFGAARLARLAATGGDVAAACPRPRATATIEPDAGLAARYADLLPRFRSLYAALRPLFRP